jgi:hypothetical protein
MESDWLTCRLTLMTVPFDFKFFEGNLLVQDQISQCMTLSNSHKLPSCPPALK